MSSLPFFFGPYRPKELFFDKTVRMSSTPAEALKRVLVPIGDAAKDLRKVSKKKTAMMKLSLDGVSRLLI